MSIVLDMYTDEDLLSKGIARDITRRVQAKRKELDLQVEDTINLSVWVYGVTLNQEDWQHVISETRAGESSLNKGDPKSDFDNFEIDGSKISFQIR